MFSKVESSTLLPFTLLELAILTISKSSRATKICFRCLMHVSSFFYTKCYFVSLIINNTPGVTYSHVMNREDRK